MSSSADAVAREASWLQVTGDALPSLPKNAGGPFDVIAAYVQGAQTRTKARAIYVTRGQVQRIRVGNQRIRPRYPMRLELRWPVLAVSPGGSSIAATEQQALDDAIQLLLERIAGPVLDKSHGGRFLAAGELKGGPGITVVPERAEDTIRASGELRASVNYFIDDYEITG